MDPEPMEGEHDLPATDRTREVFQLLANGVRPNLAIPACVTPHSGGVRPLLWGLPKTLFAVSGG